MKLTIVIPVYRVEATLDRCLQSIVDQTYTDFEVILVDDGSPDTCPQMCDRWAERDERISVIHQPNGGLSAARNAGISAARGELITFVDSDDFLDTDTYAQVMPTAEQHDITEFPVIRFYGSARARRLTFAPQVVTDREHYWLEMQAYRHTYAWNKIYRRRLFDEVRFPEGRVFEDVFTLPLLLQRAQSVATTDRGLYYYCLNPDGITSRATGKELQDLLDAHLAAMRHWCDDAYYLHVLNTQMDVYERTGKAPVLPPRTVSPLASGISGRQRLKALALYILGIERLCKLIKTIHRWIKPRS